MIQWAWCTVEGLVVNAHFVDSCANQKVSAAYVAKIECDGLVGDAQGVVGLVEADSPITVKPQSAVRGAGEFDGKVEINFLV